MIVVGQLPPENGLADALKRLATDLKTVVLADHLANIPAGDYSRFDVVLRTASEKELQTLTPDLVITWAARRFKTTEAIYPQSFCR